MNLIPSNVKGQNDRHMKPLTALEVLNVNMVLLANKILQHIYNHNLVILDALPPMHQSLPQVDNFNTPVTSNLGHKLIHSISEDHLHAYWEAEGQF